MNEQLTPIIMFGLETASIKLERTRLSIRRVSGSTSESKDNFLLTVCHTAIINPACNLRVENKQRAYQSQSL